MADLGGFLGAAGVGSAIGQAVVQLELNTAKYQAELAAAEGKTVTSTSKMGSTFSQFGGLAGAAFAAVGVAAVIGLKKSVDAAIEANDAHLKLQNTFANNKNLADSSVEAFEAQADALRDLTGVDDEAIITSQAMLGQFDLTGKQVMDLTPLIVDLSEKMDIDLQTATKAVGKATAGNTSSLARYGIQIDATDTSADAFTSTMEGLGVAQGFAAKSAEAEPWRVLSAQFEEVAEKVGQAVLPLLQDLVGVVKDLIPLLKFAADHLDLIVIALAGFAAYKYLPGLLNGIAVGMNAIAIATKSAGLLNFAQGLSAVSTALGPVTIAITAAIVAGKALNETFYGNDVSADEMADTLQGKLNKALADGTISLQEYREKVQEVNDQGDGFVKVMDQSEKALAGVRTEAAQAAQKVKSFAHMTDEELTKWSDDTKQSFESYVINLEKVQEETDFTRKDLRDSFQAMLEHARDLNVAMRTLSREHWINDDFVKFLAEQPDKLILFADSNERQQRRMQSQWETSGEILKNKVNDRLDTMTGVLDKLDKDETKHKVTIEYEYKGFDPTMPGMQGNQAR